MLGPNTKGDIVPYIIGGEEFSRKSEITDKCRHILHSMDNGDFASAEYLNFLFELFKHHDEWEEKSRRGVVGISRKMTEHGTPCFALVNVLGEKIDISFNHSIKLIPTKRTRNLTPQKLIDFKNAGRTAIKSQINDFRAKHLTKESVCPITGCKLNRDNCSVDHKPPVTFDQLLFEFSKSQNINPLNVGIKSTRGVVAEFENKTIESSWQEYHQKNANLRMLSTTGNLQLPKVKVEWSQVIA